MNGDARVRLGDIVAVARALARELRNDGHIDDAGLLDAAAGSGGSPPEALLELRSALVVTRNRWERLPDAGLVAEGRRVVAAAKRLAIEL